MREHTVYAASWVMVLYTFYRVFTTLIFLPMAGPTSGAVAYFVSLILLAIVSTVFSFTKHRSVAGALASVVAIEALSYWWFELARFRLPIWHDFGWFVVPELCFSAAGILKWLLAESEILSEKEAD